MTVSWQWCLWILTSRAIIDQQIIFQLLKTNGHDKRLQKVNRSSYLARLMAWNRRCRWSRRCCHFQDWCPKRSLGRVVSPLLSQNWLLTEWKLTTYTQRKQQRVFIILATCPFVYKQLIKLALWRAIWARAELVSRRLFSEIYIFQNAEFLGPISFENGRQNNVGVSGASAASSGPHIGDMERRRP